MKTDCFKSFWYSGEIIRVTIKRIINSLLLFFFFLITEKIFFVFMFNKVCLYNKKYILGYVCAMITQSFYLPGHNQQRYCRFNIVRFCFIISINILWLSKFSLSRWSSVSITDLASASFPTMVRINWILSICFTTLNISSSLVWWIKIRSLFYHNYIFCYINGQVSNPLKIWIDCKRRHYQAQIHSNRLS